MTRGWLLSRLGATLDYHAGEEERLLALLELSDEDLIAAIGGSRREELRRAYRGRVAAQAVLGGRAETICVHDERFPAPLRDRGWAPRALYVFGGLGRLEKLMRRPAVAIVGTRRATDYGMAMAHELASALARCGVTVVGSFADGIARAVGAGVLEAGEPALVVAPGALDDPRPASQRALWEALGDSGCLLSELPFGVRARRWCQPAHERTVVGLCELIVVVEAGAARAELRAARTASRLDRAVGALPGRLTSPASHGTNALLASGAHMIRGPGDILEVLAVGRPDVSLTSLQPELIVRRERLEARLQHVLDRVRAGQDTLARLTADGRDPAAVMAAVGELELLGRLKRGDAGRYIPSL